MEHTSSGRFTFDDVSNEHAKICVIGVGGGGGNAINNMVNRGIQGVQFISVNTDAQALSANRAPHKVQAGRDLTKGLGAGARPSIGAEAIEENRAEIEELIKGYDMVFITAGMGGGTGTGGGPVVAAIAKRLGILTVAIVTRPFQCEGRKRTKTATEGIELLRENVDTLIIIPNERLLDIAEDDTTLVEAFSMADAVLYNATRGISDLITVHGLINLDFADVKTTMVDGGTALMGAATAEGENRAERAAIEAISSPLLDGLSIKGATNVLVNITAGLNLGIREATAAISVIQQEAGDDVEVIFGTVIDEGMSDALRVTVIATGFDRDRPTQQPLPRRTVPLTDDALPYGFYKGEDNLRRLDDPAFERRSQPFRSSARLDDPEPEDQRPEETPEAQAEMRRARRINKEELMQRAEHYRHPDEKPTFLRKFMD
ncbi:MAG: cell division protein FtsZ [Bacteroidota bacterium]